MVISRPTAIFIVGILSGFVVAATLVLYFTFRNEESSRYITEMERSAPVVSVAQGDLRGEWVDGLNGDGFQYAAFRWVPYAEPPLGELRFKEPRPALKWEGVRDATEEGNVCFQASSDNSSFYGSEDCLILNVYTPQLPGANKTLLPVLVFIHGGAFISGSSSAETFGPDFLVTQEIVVVTINYRLNVLGFLNFENEIVPGSTALKDQIFALKWLKINIPQFGGDPDKITISGQSAGASSAHWLTLLPEAEGLFRAAIIMSGSAVQGWGYTEDNLWYADNLGKALGSNNLSETSRKVMEASPAEIYSAAELMINITGKVSMPGDNYLAPAMKLTPTPQRRFNLTVGQERTIIRDSESYLLNRSTPDVPILIGMTNREWLRFFYSDYTDCAAVQKQIDNLFTLLPLSIIPYQDTQRILGIDPVVAANYSYYTVADYLKANFFNTTNNDTCSNMSRFKKYFDQTLIQVDITRLVRLRARASTERTYMYQFAVKSDYNYNISEETPEEQRTAAVHGDDLRYIFHVNSISNQSWTGDGLASTTLRRMVKLWTNFVKFTDPTPRPSTNDNDLKDLKWNPYNTTNTTADTYLYIGPELSMMQDSILGEDDTKLWLDLFAKYRENRSI